MTRTKLCLLCTASGTPTDVDFPISLQSVEVLVGADFTCDPCPSLQISTKNAFVFCPDAAETVYSAQSCECVDCASSSGGA